MTFAAVSGWIALALIPIAALGGWVLRRVRRGRFALRMRPHYVLGYAAATFAAVHLGTSLDGMAGAAALGIWSATLAFVAMLLQAFLGISLQAPGAYRLILRRWHVATLVAILGLVVGHVALKSPLGGIAISVAMLR